MDRYQETFETWNKVASLYQEKFMDLDLYNATYDYICAAIPKENAKLLEIGCGPGNITQYLLSKRPDFTIHGIDIAPNMVALASKNNPNAHFEVMDSRQIGRLQTKFDGIIVGFCLPYLSQADSHALIADASRLLYEGGLLYISFVEGNPAQSGFQAGSSGNRCYFYYHSLEELQNNLAYTNFSDIKVFHIEYPKTATKNEIHMVLTAKKNFAVDSNINF